MPQPPPPPPPLTSLQHRASSRLSPTSPTNPRRRSVFIFSPHAGSRARLHARTATAPLIVGKTSWQEHGCESEHCWCCAAGRLQQTSFEPSAPSIAFLNAPRCDRLRGAPGVDCNHGAGYRLTRSETHSLRAGGWASNAVWSSWAIGSILPAPVLLDVTYADCQWPSTELACII